MQEIAFSLIPLLRYITVAFIVVFVAMLADLGAGLYKAKLRGEATRSELLKRSSYKFVLYEGGMMVAALIDVCVFLCHGFELVGLTILHGVPVISFLMAIFLCGVEGLSIREKADKKIHSEISRAEKLAKHILTHDQWVDILAGAIQKARASEMRQKSEAKAEEEDIEPVENEVI